VPVEVINGIRLHTQSLGHGGQPLVLLHGMLIGTLTSWYFAIAPLLARRRRVHMYDLRGHGLSEAPPSGYRLSDMAQDLAHVVAHFGRGEPVAVAGHSFGGAIALRFAIDHPHLVERLVLVETPLPVVIPGWEISAREQTRDTLVAMLPPILQTSFDSGRRRARRLEGRTDHLIQHTTLTQDLAAEPDIADSDIATVRCPVLMCYATYTKPEIMQSRDRLAKLLPRATVRMFEGSHYLPNESPQQIAAAIDTFLDA
jgi:pimeloyl-ACP methyl ester carboxylesterase